MLLNFCNPNQLLAAINIDGSTLTLFFRHDQGFERAAFNQYLTDTFKIRKFPGTVLSEKNHSANFHAESYHLVRLAHKHLDFGYAIDKKLGMSLLEAIKKYQSTNATSVMLRRTYEDAYRQKSYSWTDAVSWIDGVYQILDKLKNYGVKITPGLPFLTPKNLKRLAAEFSQLPARDFSTTPQIINFLNKTTNRHDLALMPAIPMPRQQRLVVNTCAQLNDLIGAQDKAVNNMFVVWESFTMVASVLSAYYFYSRCMKPAMAEEPAQQGVRRLR
jgi:hypothetical protein